jgi:dihydroflavonol-4-reductase
VKAIVLGGNGFLGMNVVRALVRGGHEVTATRRERSNTLFARKLGAQLTHADLDDLPTLIEAMRGHDVVFNCAGHYPRYSLDRQGEIDIARRRARNSVRAALRAGVARYVLSSSVATCGPPVPGRELSSEEDLPDPRASRCVYHGVKLAIEAEVIDGLERGLDAVVLCPTGVMGELDVKAGTGFVIVAMAHGRLRFYVDGRTNIVDADQMAAAHVAAAERGRTGQRYLVAGENTTVGELLQIIAAELGVSMEAQRLPTWLAGPLATMDERRCAAEPGRARSFLPREFVDIVRFGLWVDRSKAERELGIPAPIPLFETIRKARTWYERHRYFRPSA